MPLSIDLRERVVAAIDNSMRITDVVKTFKVSRKVVYNWLKLRAITNSLAPKSGYQKGHSHKIKDWDQFKAFVEKNKYMTIKEMSIQWEKLTNISISKTTIHRALKKINYTSKKNF